jgi:hypothetical protein
MDYYDTEFKMDGRLGGGKRKRNGRWQYQMALGILSDQPFGDAFVFRLVC